MGFQTPNIDTIAKEGATFHGWYGPSEADVAGRSAFITVASTYPHVLPRSLCRARRFAAGKTYQCRVAEPVGFTTQFGKTIWADRDEM